MFYAQEKKTKTISELTVDSKFYEGEIRLGASTPSFDLETEIDHKYLIPELTLDTLKNLEEKFTGEHHQLPPLFSAKRVKGKRAYEYARKNEFVELKPSLISQTYLLLMELLRLVSPSLLKEAQLIFHHQKLSLT